MKDSNVSKAELTKILEDFYGEQYCGRCEDHHGATDDELEEAARAIQSLMLREQEQTAKAYGGCTNCYGKGYATQSSRASGRGISWDTSGIVYCDCPRGEQLELVLKSQLGEKDS